MKRITIQKGQRIFETGGVTLVSRSTFNFHFQVKQDSGGLADVYLTLKRIADTVIPHWDCNSKWENPNTGRTWSCCMNNKDDRTFPYCSHSYAASLFLKQSMESE